MNCKFLASIVCIAALSLGACSGNNASGTPGSQPGDGSGSGTGNGGDGNDGETDPDPAPNPTPDPDPDDSAAAAAALQAAQSAYDDAQAEVARATAEAATAVTAEARAEARRLIGRALVALDTAVAKVGEAVDAGEAGSDADYGTALELRDEIRVYDTARRTALDTANSSLFWYAFPLRRTSLGGGDVLQVPSRDFSNADISRTLRILSTGANPDAITANTFEDTPYAAGKTVFSGSGDAFKVNGYSKPLTTDRSITQVSGGNNHHTELKLTDGGLEIRFGESTSNPWGYPDTQQRPGLSVGGTFATAGWDLKIKFKEPHFVSKGTLPAPNAVTSWVGNGDYYWRSAVDLDASQRPGGANYVANAFPSARPFDYDLGTYEVWLSNHIGVADKNTEPTDTSNPPYELDDDQFYLNYAAYGMFVYSLNPELNWQRWFASERDGRIQSINIGYTAFQNQTGKKTSDINTAIQSGTFKGQTIAVAYRGQQYRSSSVPYLPVETRLVRGNVSLTVNIPKTAGTAGNIRGTIDGFEEWDIVENRWKSGITIVSTESTPTSAIITSVTLDQATINENTGAFSGTAAAGGSGAFTTTLNWYTGNYKGNFYGPVTDSTKLEAAGSWYIGNSGDPDRWDLMGSFGAKQAQPATTN